MNEKSKVAASLPKDHRETNIKARLRQIVWEASQYMSYGQIRAYVDSVICEIADDEP